ncbi:MAG: hypothetical protein EXQ60_07975 [Candidatus Nanopelagicales bacterium]|nr:hypothetical protein [Candidatus Nanopelagicales bacterium]
MRLRREAPKELSYVTVVTYGRTGSTAIQASLNALPGVLVRGENYSALRGLGNYLQSIAEVADRHHAGKPSHPWYGSAQLDPGAVLADIRRHVTDYVLRPDRNANWIGFKEVRYEPGHFGTYDELLQHLIFMGRLFPGLRYLMNVREPADAARSGWWPDNSDALEVLTTTRAWLLLAVTDLNDFFGADRAVGVAYEQWSVDPQYLIDAYAGLGLPRDDDAVRAALAERLEHGSHVS